MNFYECEKLYQLNDKIHVLFISFHRKYWFIVFSWRDVESVSLKETSQSITFLRGWLILFCSKIIPLYLSFQKEQFHSLFFLNIFRWWFFKIKTIWFNFFQVVIIYCFSLEETSQAIGCFKETCMLIIGLSLKSFNSVFHLKRHADLINVYPKSIELIEN